MVPLTSTGHYLTIGEYQDSGISFAWDVTSFLGGKLLGSGLKGGEKVVYTLADQGVGLLLSNLISNGATFNVANGQYLEDMIIMDIDSTLFYTEEGYNVSSDRTLRLGETSYQIAADRLSFISALVDTALESEAFMGDEGYNYLYTNFSMEHMANTEFWENVPQSEKYSMAYYTAWFFFQDKPEFYNAAGFSATASDLLIPTIPYEESYMDEYYWRF